LGIILEDYTWEMYSSRYISNGLKKCVKYKKTKKYTYCLNYTFVNITP
jgi:hypothetical protein